ncbi:cell adhesion molecule CEACAM20 [Salminus brasiliensis]|uniref:cell adhesion molecule CEACAM20 n=1 Tax=Salminus brasiliensis TaxID=930266 RepID=UPI003B82CA3A
MAVRSLCWALTLLVFGGVCSGQELQLPSRVNGATRENVVFKPSRLPSGTYDGFNWNFKTTPIISVIGSSSLPTAAYRERISLNMSTLALELRNLTENDSGPYSLSITGTADTYTAETTLEVFEKISEVRLIGPSELIIEGSSTNLTCQASGMVVSTEWTKDSQKLSPSSSVIFSPNTRSVTINPVQPKDSGEYRCTLSNPVSSGFASYTMIVNYGPDGVHVTGPSEVEVEGNLVLACRADSVPEPVYEWQFNGLKTEVTTATFSVQQVNFTHSGNYTCIAWNNVTRCEASGSHMLAVKGKRTGGGGPLSAGAIAGIVIGVLLGVAGVVGLIVYFLKVKGRPKSSSEEATKNGGDSGGFYENTRDLRGNPPPPPGGTNKEDPNYENVRQLPSIPLAYRGMRPNQRS